MSALGGRRAGDSRRRSWPDGLSSVRPLRGRLSCADPGAAWWCPARGGAIARAGLADCGGRGQVGWLARPARRAAMLPRGAGCPGR